MSQPANADGRKWWPAAYMDEIMPTGRASPDEWLIRLPGDGFAVASPYHGSEFETDREAKWSYAPLTAGARVDFAYYDDLGTVEITVNPNGTFELHGLVDPRATYFAEECNTDSMQSDIDEFAKNYAGEISKSKRMSMWTGYWSDNVVLSLKLEGGTASFEEAGTA